VELVSVAYWYLASLSSVHYRSVMAGGPGTHPNYE
jgi:hypothetical protein